MPAKGTIGGGCPAREKGKREKRLAGRPPPVSIGLQMQVWQGSAVILLSVLPKPVTALSRLLSDPPLEPPPLPLYLLQCGNLGEQGPKSKPGHLPSRPPLLEMSWCFSLLSSSKLLFYLKTE